MQMSSDNNQNELLTQLDSIVSHTSPDAHYAQYHAKALELALHRAEQLKLG